MDMQNFLTQFRSDVGFRNGAMGSAFAQSPTLFNDLAFLAAVFQFEDDEGGKKKAMQIQILFCIPKRGAGAANPYAISPATQQPLSLALQTLNTETIIPIKQSLTDLKNKRRDIDDAKQKGGVSKLVAGFKGLALKAGTKGRAIDTGLFDGVVADVVAAGGRLDHFVQGYDGEFGNLPTADPHVKGLQVLATGKMGANFDTSQMGIY